MIRAAASLLLLSASALAQHAIWVVAPTLGPGVDFTTVSAAAVAAASGDTIVLKSGTYQGLGIGSDKTLSITADTGADVHMGGSVVTGLKEPYLVTLSHISFWSDDEDFPGLRLQDNAGPVWLDHCKISGFSWYQNTNLQPTEGLKIDQCASVVITHCDVHGGSSLGGVPGLRATDSTIYVFRSKITGGSGGCLSSIHICYDSATGIEVTGGLLALQSSQIFGGLPQASPQCIVDGWPYCICGVGGGIPLHLLGGAPQVQAYDVQLSAGTFIPPCGFPGSTLTQVDSGQFLPTAGPGFEIAGSSPLRVGDPGAFDFSGQPGDSVWTVLSIFPSAFWAPKFHGPWLTGGNFQLLFLGTLPGSGAMSFNFTVPSLPPGFESVEFIAQGVRVAPGTGTLLANPLREILIGG